MLSNATRKVTLALTLALLAVPFNKAIAQSTTPTPSTPAVVTGTDPEPQVVTVILLSILLSA
jgi:hypothetical protein